MGFFNLFGLGELPGLVEAFAKALLGLLVYFGLVGAI